MTTRDEEYRIRNELRWLRCWVSCFALLSAGLVLSSQELASQTVSKDEIKTKIEERDAAPSAEALTRKQKSIARLKEKNVPTIQHLPVIEDSQSAKERTKEEIAQRAIALCLVAVKGEGLDQATVDELIKKYGAETYFTPAERKFVRDTSPTRQERIQFSWRYEAYWVMLWTLGYVETLDYPIKVCDVPKAVGFLRDNSVQEFVAKARLRDLSEVLDQADLIYRYHWAVVDARLKQQKAPAGIDGGVVQERHHALNWLIGYMNQEWDDVTTDT